jgi:hypothetical protein
MIAEPGIHLRSPIGLLIWMRNEEKTASYKLGSRLKTPIYPIWLIVASEQSGVLFSDDRDLLRDYRSEIRWGKKYFKRIHWPLKVIVYRYPQVPVTLLHKYAKPIDSCCASYPNEDATRGTGRRSLTSHVRQSDQNQVIKKKLNDLDYKLKLCNAIIFCWQVEWSACYLEWPNALFLKQ